MFSEDTEAQDVKHLKAAWVVRPGVCTEVLSAPFRPETTGAEVCVPTWMGGRKFIRKAESMAQKGAHLITIPTN